MDRQLLAVAIAAALAAGTVAALGTEGLSSEGTVAKVELSGSITPTASTGLGSVDSITPQRVRELRERAMQREPEALLYEINSPGGAVVASKDVKRIIENTEVPTVCRLRDLAASGGYLIALGCDSIVADSATLTGSIGVKGSYFELTGLMEKLGVEYVNVSSGRYKEVGSPFKNASDEELDVLEKRADAVHRQFIDLVREERNISEEELEEASKGQPVLGERARELSLVDRLGGREVALGEAENLTGSNLTAERVENPSNLDLLSILTGGKVSSLISKSSLLEAKIG